jgi:hypothetical protein
MFRSLIRKSLWGGGSCALVMFACSSVFAQTKGKSPAKDEGQETDASAVASNVRKASDDVLLNLQREGDYDAGSAAMLRLFDQVTAYGDPDDRTLFRDAAFNVRLVKLVAAA